MACKVKLFDYNDSMRIFHTLLFSLIFLSFSFQNVSAGESPARKALSLLKADNISGSFDVAKTECEKGNAELCWFIATRIVYPGEDYRVQYDRSSGYYSKACVLGHPEACHNYAQGLKHKYNTLPKDAEKEVRDHYTLGCEGGFLKSCHSLGLMQRAGEGGNVMIVEAKKNFERVCSGGGIAKSCVFYGNMLLSGEGGDQDPERARSVFKRACEKLGDYDACFRFADTLTMQEAGDLDYARAAEIYSQNCEFSIGGGCAGYAELLAAGNGVEQNHALAISYYKKACDMDYAKGCFQHARYLDAQPTKAQFHANIGDLLERACEGGYAGGCVALAERYKAFPTPGETAEFAAYKIKKQYWRACELGDQKACALSD